MKLYIFGNGNTSFDSFLNQYVQTIKTLDLSNTEFIVCDFRGVDTMTMEYLKTKSSKVSVFHIGENPRYLPDRYKTKVDSWKIMGGFHNDEQRDTAAIDHCTHFLAFDFNSSPKRKSGTQRNIERCLSLQKTALPFQ